MLKYEMVSTHDLRPGDVVSSHGALFELQAVTWYSARLRARGWDCAILAHTWEDILLELDAGPVVSCTVRLLNDGGSIPRSWLADYTIQGNRNATWARVIH